MLMRRNLRYYIDKIGFFVVKRRPNKLFQNKTYWHKRATIGVSAKIRNDFVDMDYLHKLNKEEFDFLKQFSEEYYNSNLKINMFHKTKKLKKMIWDKNNARQRCIYANYKTIGRLYPMGLFLDKIAIFIPKEMRVK